MDVVSKVVGDLQIQYQSHYMYELISLIYWISDALSQGYTILQSLVKCLDHRYSMQSSKVVLGCAMH